MSFEEFENKARLYVLGALDESDVAAFESARREFGARGEEFIRECHKLNSVFALSLQPTPPRPETKEKLMSRIRQAMEREGRAASETNEV